MNEQDKERLKTQHNVDLDILQMYQNTEEVCRINVISTYVDDIDVNTPLHTERNGVDKDN